MTINVLINGANGKMGQETVNAVTHDPALSLVGRTHKGDDLTTAIRSTDAHVVIDFTVAGQGFHNTKTIIESGAHPVIGTSGFTLDEIQQLQKLSADKKCGGIIAPNFSIAAVLMMQCAQRIAQHLPSAEIIEMHHQGKIDAPSFTAIKTAEMIAEGRSPTHKTDAPTDTSRARGMCVAGTPIHAVRLPGLIAHQTVLFGGHYETLSMQHDSLSRAAFMPGVVLACKKVVALDALVYGLENLLS